ncbi:alpha/beta fold hydrolase [Saccharothrix sp. AJ9571]|nr:alpha/beta fold hydrolase [Saccharothrix sp. AJ9571]
MSWPYSGLLRYLDRGIPVYGLQARGLTGIEPLPDSITAVAEDYVEQILRVQPAGPYYLLGWSLGGIVAHTIAERLERRGHEVGLLVLLDCKPARTLDQDEVERGVAMIETSTMYRGLLNLFDVDVTEEEAKSLSHDTVAEILRTKNTALASLDEAEIQAMTAVTINNVRMEHRHVHGRIAAETLLVAATDEVADVITADAWRDHIDGAIELRTVECKHTHMLTPGPLADIGPIVAEKLDRVIPENPSITERGMRS